MRTDTSNTETPTSTHRLTRKGKPSWEELVERLEYNMPAWNASNWIVKHNIKIIRHVQHIQDYELGKRSDPPPFSFAELLNPRTNAKSPSVKRNTGLDRLDYLFASLKRYEPGHAPAQNYEPVFISTRALLLLLKKCADVYGRRPEEQQLARSLEYVYALQRFIEDPQTLHLTRQKYDEQLDAMHERIASSFIENALLFEALAERRKMDRSGQPRISAPVTRAELHAAVKTILRGEDVNAAKPGPRLTPAKRRQIEAAENYRATHRGCTLHNACLRSFVRVKGGYASGESLYESMHQKLEAST